MSEHNGPAVPLCALVAALMIVTMVLVPAPAVASDGLEDIDASPCVWVDPGGPGVIVDIGCIIRHLTAWDVPP